MTYAASLTAMVLVFDLGRSFYSLRDTSRNLVRTSIGLIWGLDPSTMSKAACLTQMGLVTFFGENVCL
jgi:hypothetical protein